MHFAPKNRKRDPQTLNSQQVRSQAHCNTLPSRHSSHNPAWYYASNPKVLSAPLAHPRRPSSKNSSLGSTGCPADRKAGEFA
ncbi:hypothetical protein EKH55_5390 [Sinorhizobium alkalisoli]|nr:hypothetical protein EKH55_5390 [Sinorhizobium alkalisoli]